MFALVKFLEEFDSNRLYVVDADTILDFHPKSTDDFDNRAIYSVFWVDENSENTQAYKAQVLLLAESKEELDNKKSCKRVQIPKIRMDSDDDEPSNIQDRKEASQKRKNAQAHAKSNTYAKILEKHVKDVQRKAKGDSCSQPRHQGPLQKKPRLNDTSSSDDDESLVSAKELRREIAEKKMWRKRTEKLEEENSILLQQIQSLQRCLESKIFQTEAIQSPGCSMEPKGTRPIQVTKEKHGRMENFAFARKGVTPEAAAVSSGAATEEMSGTEDNPFREDDSEVDKARCITVPETDFVHLPDGSFHLAKGVIITASQAAKILNNKKATLVCKDTAQAIWGTEVLSERSVCGVAAPKAKAAGQLPKQPLTPAKVDVVAATVRHWGTIKGEDVTSTISNITKGVV
ncbi:BEN domain-containing protein 5-like isoform X2 [Rhipicephalus sanguineus]|uniref:BEN domain-containing protein 5-like isoform X2 n=1 Tax=Rhipicephalus sanguineus TaxID=34632 RepID=UPI0018938BDF|nr:BEN domain-containing protein 5-like isoform X2 [Rhipicephalus sanguineus]